VCKKVFHWAGVLGLVLAAAPWALAQSAGNAVRIYTEPAGVYFTVDGENFLSAATLLWPAVSKHLISSYDQSISPGTRFTFDGTVHTNLGDVKAGVPITADPALKWIKLTFKTDYLLTYDLPDCPATVSVCLSGGTINGHDRRTLEWVGAGSGVTAVAVPNSGYVFVGWGTVWQLGRPTQFIISFPMLGPLTLTAFFQPANAVKTEVSVITDPPQLQLLLDRTPYTAPVNLEWGWNTTHSVGANPVQVAQGVTYVFQSWSDGGAINHDFQVPSQSGAINLMAKFVPATVVAFQTSPPGLALSVDGRQNWSNYSFAWLPGSTHQISAPATQTDAQGHKYRFVSWSNEKPASFDYTAGPAPGNERITAVYQPVAQVTFTSDPPAVVLQVDGAACTTPCTVERDAGATVTVSAPQLRSTNENSRLTFQGWADSAEATRSIALTAGSKTYTAEYRLQNRLSAAATPPEGASLVVTPSSPDGFYDSGTLVSIAAKLGLGFRINMWSGDVSGNGGAAAVTLDVPKTAMLLLDRVPAIAPLGIRNAAAGASTDGVAPGSLISIYGANLAPELHVGPPNPLAQTLSNVTVRVDDTFLPLMFVSPEQINAQLPAGIPEGKHKITVRWEGKPETAVDISVVRNAPGLFASGQQEQPVGLFVRADGSLATPDHPCEAGEVVSVLGTGLGPYTQQPPDGFLLDEASGFTLIDEVSVILGDDLTLSPLYAGRSGAGVAIDAVQFRVPAGLAGDPVRVRIRVNGKESNTVLLPISGKL
jgi:uncharacterized protein (TIGR03437 family)